MTVQTDEERQRQADEDREEYRKGLFGWISDLFDMAGSILSFVFWGAAAVLGGGLLMQWDKAQDFIANIFGEGALLGLNTLLGNIGLDFLDAGQIHTRLRAMEPEERVALAKRFLDDSAFIGDNVLETILGNEHFEYSFQLIADTIRGEGSEQDEIDLRRLNPERLAAAITASFDAAHGQVGAPETEAEKRAFAFNKAFLSALAEDLQPAEGEEPQGAAQVLARAREWLSQGRELLFGSDDASEAQAGLFTTILAHREHYQTELDEIFSALIPDNNLRGFITQDATFNLIESMGADGGVLLSQMLEHYDPEEGLNLVALLTDQNLLSTLAKHKEALKNFIENVNVASLPDTAQGQFEMVKAFLLDRADALGEEAPRQNLDVILEMAEKGHIAHLQGLIEAVTTGLQGDNILEDLPAAFGELQAAEVSQKEADAFYRLVQELDLDSIVAAEDANKNDTAHSPNDRNSEMGIVLQMLDSNSELHQVATAIADGDTLPNGGTEGALDTTANLLARTLVRAPDAPGR